MKVFHEPYRTHQDLSHDTTFSQIKSRVPVPLNVIHSKCSSVQKTGTQHSAHRQIVVPVPNSGIASDTRGSVSVTMLWKTVSERRIVTSEIESSTTKFNLSNTQENSNVTSAQYSENLTSQIQRKIIHVNPAQY